ncbi:hypothetical protein IQ07DRAFT_389178 [Pyrenochaeta sp. DS3sAY3a]|nr:hypothetical protein IQ07DRAFT_389178 [Pyrenochaeta sp. DS3sAY3a]
MPKPPFCFVGGRCWCKTKHAAVAPCWRSSAAREPLHSQTALSRARSCSWCAAIVTTTVIHSIKATNAMFLQRPPPSSSMPKNTTRSLK